MNGHNHAVNPTTTRVEEIKSELRKRAIEEVIPVPTLYNEALVELSTQPDRSDVAPTCTELFIDIHLFSLLILCVMFSLVLSVNL